MIFVSVWIVNGRQTLKFLEDKKLGLTTKTTSFYVIKMELQNDLS